MGVGGCGGAGGGSVNVCGRLQAVGRGDATGRPTGRVRWDVYELGVPLLLRCLWASNHARDM